jgi:hypothetical protein
MFHLDFLPNHERSADEHQMPAFRQLKYQAHNLHLKQMFIEYEGVCIWRKPWAFCITIRCGQYGAVQTLC